MLSQRWLQTQRIYDAADPKPIYHLSMEFLIGRSLNNNITNLMLHPNIERAARERNLDWAALVDQEPDAGLGNGGLGRLAARFLDSMATLKLPAMGCGLRYEFGMFRQVIEDGWQREHADYWLRLRDPWEVEQHNEAVEIRLDSSFEMHGGSLRIAYLEVDGALCAQYSDRDGWARKAILNIAASGVFSSDETISRYASEIWKATPCPVPLSPRPPP